MMNASHRRMISEVLAREEHTMDDTEPMNTISRHFVSLVRILKEMSIVY